MCIDQQCMRKIILTAQCKLTHRRNDYGQKRFRGVTAVEIKWN